MRLIALAIVVLAGAVMVGLDCLPNTYGGADDLGFFTIFVGLVALGIELYVLPFIRKKRGDGFPL